METILEMVLFFSGVGWGEVCQNFEHGIGLPRAKAQKQV